MFVFLIVTVLLLPVIMICIGLLWRKHPPKRINPFYGYRTLRSMASDKSWRFAHMHFAKTWLVEGSVFFPVTATLMLLFQSHYEIASMVLIGVQLFAVCLSIVPTERALKYAFDEQGNPRNGSGLSS
ncbi:MAG TPA: SdpI family protein [Clostridia bacterium]|nr:SdpI family protein [Clostridia bacterium]